MIKNVQSARLSVCRWLAYAALGSLALNAFAVPVPSGGSTGFNVETRGGNLRMISVAGTAHSHLYVKNPTISATSPVASASIPPNFINKAGAAANATVNWPIDNAKVINKAAAALKAGAASAATTGNAAITVASVACVFVCAPLAEAISNWGVNHFEVQPDGSVGVSKPDESLQTSTGFLWSPPGGGAYVYPTPEASCKASWPAITFEPRPSASNPNIYDCYSSQAGGNMGQVSRQQSNCPSGHYINSSGTCFAPQDAPTAFEPIETYLQSNYRGTGWNSQWAAITAGLVAAGVDVFTDGAGSTITGPAVVPLTTSSSTAPVNVHPGTNTPVSPGHAGPSDPAIQTTTTTTTAHNDYRPGSSSSGPSIQTTTKTQTTTSITNQITNNTTTIINNSESDDSPDEEQKDQCEKYPDSLSCVELDTPEGEVPESQINIDYEYTDLFGNGSCPPDSYANVGGQNLKVWDWQATCSNVSSYFQGVLIACCAFAAFVIVAGGAKE